MNKLLVILLLLIAASGAYYCYDKYVAPNYFGGSGAGEDARITALRAEAERLFPTKIKEREDWFALQTAALKRIDIPQRGVPSEMAKKIRESANERYPLNYDKQLSYIHNQEVAAKTLNMMLVDVAMSGEDSARIIAIMDKKAKGDYIAQTAILRELLRVYGHMRRKGSDMNRDDFRALMGNMFEIMADNPTQAEALFDRQYLARHNYLTKTIPEHFGNLREGIEEMFPGDFVAQLSELDKRVNSVLHKKAEVSFEGSQALSTNLARKIFKKYIYLQNKKNGVHCSYFTEMKGRQIMLFPGEMLDDLEDVFTMDSGDLAIKSDGVYISKEESVGMVVLNNPADVSKIEFMPKSEVINGEFEVEIVGVNEKGQVLGMKSSLKNGVLESLNSAAKIIARTMKSGALVVDSESEKILGVFVLEPSSGGDFYRTDGDRDDLLSIMQSKDSEKGMRGAHRVLRANLAAFSDNEDRNFKMVFCEDFQNWEKFSKAKYKGQYNMIKEIADSNYWMSRFIMYNLYGDALDSPMFSAVARRYEKSFSTRQKERSFAGEYSRYLGDIANLYRNALKMPKNAGADFYYPLRKAAAAQCAFAENLNLFARETLAGIDKKELVHDDLFEFVKGDTYIPSASASFRKGGLKDATNAGGAMTIKMSN